MTVKNARKVTQDLLDFIVASPTSGHAATESVRRLKAAGFKELKEENSWKFAPGDKLFARRGIGSVMAFRVGAKPVAQAGFRIAGAHTDAPGFRIKPNHLYESAGYTMIGVETYGGPLLGSWTDRDLSLAGYLVVEGKNSALKTVLVDLKKPVCHIPQLAIHLNRQVNDKGLKLDKQKHMPLILGLTDGKKLDPDLLIKQLAKVAKVDPKKVLDFSIQPYDVQAPAIGGLNDEFYFTARIDNLNGTHAALQAIIDAPDKAPFTRIAALYDNEEIGSATYTGAGSSFLETTMERLCLNGKNPRENFLRAISKSILISNDGSHAVHPNYSDMHDPRHQPKLNGGPVIKINANQRYASIPETGAHFITCAKRANAPYQVFVNRSDLPAGSTIGPITATRLGIPTVDVGSPMLSMHSIRETGGVMDQAAMIKVIVEHFTK